MDSGSTIKIIEVQSGETLFECSIEDSEKAYRQATHYDGLGLEVKVVIPSTTRTLFDALKKDPVNWDRVEDELNEEIDSHDDSCCNKYTDSDNPTYQ
jgi:hypothetical protein